MGQFTRTGIDGGRDRSDAAGGMCVPPESCKIYTPFVLARAMVRTVHENGHQTWLEPCVGRGVFLFALQEQGVASERAFAVDLDSTPADGDALGCVLRGADFLQWSCNTRRRFDCVVGNPPFVAIRSLPSPLRETAARVQDHLGNSVGLSANTWYAFLLRAVELLKKQGSLAFVLPAACEYADYCRPGREAIAGLFERTDLVRSRTPLFSDVQEGAAVLVCQRKGASGGLFRRHEVDDLNGVVERLASLDGLKARKCPNGQRGRCRQRDVRLGDVLDIGLGGVTGDAKYFILTESQRKNLGLPVGCVRPVVSRSRHLHQASVSLLAWKRLRIADERVWLFDPPLSFLKHVAVRRYLDKEANEGGCRRSAYKIRNRDPWYRTPLPKSPHGFISGMTGRGIWLCLNEMVGLNATNTLYVARFRRTLSRAERYAWALALLTTPAARRVRRATRVYADGLRKIEPGQLADVQVPEPPPIRNAVSMYRTALRCLLDGNERECRALADDAVLGTTG